MTTDTVSVSREDLDVVLYLLRRKSYSADSAEHAAVARVTAAIQQPAAPAISKIGEYTTGDDDLDLLLDLTHSMAEGKANHDTGVLWMDTLEKVKARLQQTAAPDLSVEISSDRAFLDGLRLGWNFAIANDQAGYSATQYAYQKQITEAKSEQPDIHTQPDCPICGKEMIAKIEEDLRLMRCDKCGLEHANCEQPSANDIRRQLLAYVPPLSEWPEGAEFWAADGDTLQGWFYDTYPCRIAPPDGGYGYWISTDRADGSDGTNTASRFWLPKEFARYWCETRFSREELTR